jgi:hypothetical protein
MKNVILTCVLMFAASASSYSLGSWDINIFLTDPVENIAFCQGQILNEYESSKDENTKARDAYILCKLWEKNLLENKIKDYLVDKYYRVVLVQSYGNYQAPNWEVQSQQNFPFPNNWVGFTPTLYKNGDVIWAPSEPQTEHSMSQNSSLITSRTGGEFNNGDEIYYSINISEKKNHELVWEKVIETNHVFLQRLRSSNNVGLASGGRINLNLKSEKPLVQIAVLLDTSNSMDGLIAQAKTQLWSLVSEFIFAKRNGVEPEIQVALYEYGNDSLNAQTGYIRQVLPFTTDLDKVSEELFVLKTNGGQEYCGWVIQEATRSLKWSISLNDLKVIFIAGNEPFTQGNVDYNKSCKEAIAKGIIVNTIFCGPESEGINTHWKDGAVLADGSFLNIDQNRRVVQINAPHDKEIAELNNKLNETYIAFGSNGTAGQERQIEQDKNAASISMANNSSRALAKSSQNYLNSDWDLVDALKAKQVDLKDIKREDLPENMQAMSIDERKTYADSKAAERLTIQKRIQELNTQRETYIQNEMKKQASGQSANTLGSAMNSTIRQQAMQKNFAFTPPASVQQNTQNTPASK